MLFDEFVILGSFFPILECCSDFIMRKGYLISMLFKGFCFFFFLVSKSFSCISLHVVLCYAHKSLSRRYITIEDLKEESD